MTSPDIYVVGAARTAIGTFGGALKDVPLTQLATTALRAALQRRVIDPQSVGQSRDPYLPPAARRGARMGDATATDYMLGSCTTRSTRSTWASGPRTSQRRKASAARCKTRSRCKASSAPRARASKSVLKRLGMSVSDLDVIESNEAFAPQACAVTKLLKLDPDNVNPNGSGISPGCPVGATGAIIATKAIHESHRIDGHYALVTMCIGGGQGIAAVFETA